MVRHVENMNLRDLFIEYLTGLGFVENKQKTTGKYVCLQSPKDSTRLFLGANGAVRKGVSISGSLSITANFTNEVALGRIKAKVQADRDAKKLKK